MPKLTSHPVRDLTGNVTVPGDKSISHRALILGSLAVGKTTISGLLEGHDVINTAAAMTRFGATVTRGEGGAPWQVQGVGVGGLGEACDVIDMGNSGTGIRLLMGLAASHAITTVFTGDASLRGRPMGRVSTPLEAMGAR
ncbi:MAG: 3-phosphoshikimate 1-carboxyvinyltransferase, partial [Sphingomonadales bacterium]